MIYMKSDDEISEFDGVNILIFPLKKDELELLKKDKNEFAKYINLDYQAEDFSAQNMQDIYNNKYQKLCEHPDEWVFHTFWTIVSLKDRTIVGNIYFKNKPCVDIAEVRFNVSSRYENQGFATLALELMCQFAQKCEIKKVVANIEPTNIQALKVLEKNNFRLKNKSENILNLEKDI